jgi:Ras GTPase-activating-like protein IQGAP2/3
VDYDAQITRTNADLEKLKAVLSSIQEHNEFLKQQYVAYKEYLNNVRENCSSANTKTSGKKVKESNAKKGPFKFSHTQLQKDGIIIESEVPEERFSIFFFFHFLCLFIPLILSLFFFLLFFCFRRSSIFFSFTAVAPGIFNVAVMYKSRTISSMSLQLDDLLERQQNNQLELETDFLKLNVNLLLFLLNKTFVS